MAHSIQSILEFAVQHKGVLMAEAIKQPHRKKYRITFPTKLTRRNPQGVKSPFMRECINQFYPGCEDQGKDHSLIVFTDDGIHEVILLEGNIDAKDGLWNSLGLDFLAYGQIRKSPGEWKGVKGILLQTVPETVE